ncbi:uncharacterized protein B0P05DRAFT_543168 [Gilbertella persicaria]|uniref:uncharacterized protein n=1 Tax=Gilbertella persicaria TaxID=101096 RepID=UPI002221251E|nr:uncharacterized protein B0P05DRAFT_543168 [Gilbertella persicaria]KAI8078279.1 hypothetical protein B0P05DRAFT_543168 [Gilbertella persicaria]
MTDKDRLVHKLPVALSALVGSIVFQAIFRKRGGFMYRQAVAVICIMASAFYGVLASLTLPLFGKAHLINWSVARVEYYLCKTFLGITATVEGKENLPSEDEQVVYVCNHQSMMDIMYMARVFPKRTSVVAKKVIKYYPFLGWFMMLSKAVFLDRGNRESAIKEAKNAAKDIHKKKTSVWIFPEGTRGNSAEIDLLPFKKGAFYMAAQAKVPIVPIVIANYKDIYHTKSKRFGHGDIKIKILPRVSTESILEDSDDINKLVNQVRNQMLNVLKEISVEKNE